MYTIKIKKNKMPINSIFVSLICSVIVINYILTWTDFLVKVYALITFAVSVFFLKLIIERKNKALVISSVFVFHCNYSVVIGVYFESFIIYQMYRQIKDVNVYGVTIGLLLIFLCVFSLGLYNDEISSAFIELELKENKLLFWIIEIGLIFIFIFATGHEIGKRENTALYEYSVIFFIVQMYYAGKNSLLKGVTFITIVVFSAMSFLKGNRVEAICFLIAVFIIYYSNRFKLWMIVVGTLIATFGMEILGYVRDGNLSIINILKKVYEYKLVQRTAVSAYFPALTIDEMRLQTNWVAGFEQFVTYVKYVFLGAGVKDFNLIELSRSEHVHSGGSFSFAFFYYWFKEIGVIIYGLLMSKIYHALYEGKTRYIKFLAIYLCATIPRSYLYGPSSLFRGALFFSIVYYVGVYLPEKLVFRVRST